MDDPLNLSRLLIENQSLQDLERIKELVLHIIRLQPKQREGLYVIAWFMEQRQRLRDRAEKEELLAEESKLLHRLEGILLDLQVAFREIKDMDWFDSNF